MYRVYRSLSSDVDSSSFLVNTLRSIGANSIIDTGLDANTAYFYRVYVVDNTGLWTGSNVYSGTTGLDAPPEPANLFPVIVEPDDYRDVQLNWDQPNTNDFSAFHLISWREDLGRDDSTVIAIFTSDESTSFTDHPSFDVPGDTVVYMYMLQTYDEAGNFASSNIIAARLEDHQPEELGGAVYPGVDFIGVTWIQSEIPDFSNYKILRDTLSVPGQAQIVYMTTDRNVSNYEDHGAVQGRLYYYWIDVFDRRGNSARSFLGSAQW
jgi:hypothetical protein